MKNRAKSFLALLAAMTGATLILAAAAPEYAIAGERGADSKAVPKPTESGGMQKEIKPAKLSFGLEDIAKMVQSGVDTDVVLTFLENSTVAYYATAEDVIHLHEFGVPSQITASLIRHGGKLRAQQAQTAKVSQTAPVKPATPNATYGYEPQSVQSTYVTHNYGYPAYVYRGYPNCNYVYPYPGYSYFSYPSYFSYSTPFYFRHRYPYRYNRYYSRSIHSGIRVGFNSGRFFHGSPGIRVRGRFWF